MKIVVPLMNKHFADGVKNRPMILIGHCRVDLPSPKRPALIMITHYGTVIVYLSQHIFLMR